jgi:hypothetical protein
MARSVFYAIFATIARPARMRQILLAPSPMMQRRNRPRAAYTGPHEKPCAGRQTGVPATPV